MSIRVKKQGKDCRLTLEGDLTIYEAASIYEALSKHLTSCKNLEVDLNGITELDTAGVQILLALKQAATAQGKCLSLRQHSDPVVDVFELLNIVHEFGDPMVLSHRAMN